jgi:tetratricopeptide (TPR) repeat protein
MRYRETDKPLPQIARELNVDAVITGSVLRSGDRVRITAQLIDAVTEEHLWADRYEREFRDVLSLGNDVVVAITSAIRLQLTPQERAKLADARPVNPETYEAYVKGMYYLYKKTPEGFAKGLALLQQAIDKDPSDPLPHAGLALAYPIIYHGPGGTTPPKEGFPRAREAALEALKLDESSAQAHLALAAVKMYFDWDWDGAEREFRRALDLNPNLVEAHAHYAWYLHLFNRNEEGLAEAKKAQELDPLTPTYTAWVGWLYLNLGDLENAELEARKALEIDPDLPDALYVLGCVYGMENAIAEAIAVAEKLAAVNPDWRFMLAMVYAASGRRDEALELVADMEREDSPKFGIWIYTIQTILGDKDEALRALDAAFDHHSIFLPWVMRDSKWREDPRWQEMRRRLNFPPG